MKKKIVILGPITDVGGREVEVNIIAKALMNDYDVSILSTTYITNKSAALKDINGLEWTSIQEILYEKNVFIKTLSTFSKLYKKGKDKNYNYISNRIVKKFFELNNLYLDILKKELSKVDLVILPVQLTTKFLAEIIDFCDANKIKCVVRTTGTIGKIGKNISAFLKKIDLFVHHSNANAKNINRQIDLPYELVDQCTLNEEKLLDIPLNKNKPLIFGFIGRLSEEKGVIPLVDYFMESNNKLIIAGDGQQKEVILKKTERNPQIHYIGLLESNSISVFFKKIDVLIISSLEESGPLVGIEAMAAGKIIISTDVGAMKNRLKDTKNDFWFDIKNTTTLDEVILRINALSSNDLYQISESVRKTYLENYSVEKIKNEYQNIVSKLINA
ncbi:MAG: glycosyltransferase [Flavobacteriaceae bacterium]|nr:glycosyltransferase [Flavobacteriaceae bacterium]